MLTLPIYMDNHATTRVDPRVVEAMLPYFSEIYGNAGSPHAFGKEAKEAVRKARESIAAAVGASAKEIIFTSGATESNNLAIRGAAASLAARGRHIVSVATEHPSVREPLEALRREGFEITLLPVAQHGRASAGLVDPQQVADVLREDTILVSVMYANNEIGAIHPIGAIAAMCRKRNVLLHTDATQAFGKLPLEVAALGVDLASFSAHKVYGPKGIGALYVRRRSPAVRLTPLIEGGGQEQGLRSGTLNVPGIVGFARAAELAHELLPGEARRLNELRARLWAGLRRRIKGVALNGPAIDNACELATAPAGVVVTPGVSEMASSGAAAAAARLSDGVLSANATDACAAIGGAVSAIVPDRLPGNLNVSFEGLDGELILLKLPELAVSSGAACSSASPEPSHVLRALGLRDDVVRSSLRFGLGRFNTEEEVDYVIDLLADTVFELRAHGGV